MTKFTIKISILYTIAAICFIILLSNRAHAYTEIGEIDGVETIFLHTKYPHSECRGLGAQASKNGGMILGCQLNVLGNYLIILPFPDDPRYDCIREHEIKHARFPAWRHNEDEGCG